MPSEADAKLLTTARRRYDAGIDFDRDNRDEALKDARYLAGEQWPDEVKREREKAGRPCFTVNRLGQFVRQVTGDIRKNPPGVKVRPVDDGSDPKLAEALTGIIRNIEAQSAADRVYGRAADSQVATGIGHFRVTTEYVDEGGWEQDIRIRSIPDAGSVVWDPNAREVTREDAMWVFVTQLVSREQFEEDHPDHQPADWDTYAKEYPRWTQGDMVRVAEYWTKEPTTRTLVETRDGKTMWADEAGEDFLAILERDDFIKRRKKVRTHKVVHRLLSADAVLEGPTDWPGRYFPIIPVIGVEVAVGERIVRHGVVRFARDPQTLYNIHRSALAESIAMAPKPKWLATPKMIAGYEEEWANANVSADAYLPYTPDPGAPSAMPQRVPAAVPDAGLLQDLGIAAGDFEATTGLHPASLGMEGQEKSGRAILARQREGDTGTFVYSDNLALAVAHGGRVTADLLPKIYDTQRTLRVLGEDGSEEFFTANMVLPDGQVVNDLSQGRYDVVPSTGPSYSTKLEESRDSMLAFMQMGPENAAMIPDLFAKAQDWPYAEEISKRFRKGLIARGVVEADPQQGEQPPQPQPDPAMLLAQAEVQKAQAAAMKAQFDAQAKQSEASIRIRELTLQEREVALKEWQAGMKVQQDQAATRLEGIKTAASIYGDAQDRAMRAEEGARSHGLAVAGHFQSAAQAEARNQRPEGAR